MLLRSGTNLKVIILTFTNPNDNSENINSKRSFQYYYRPKGIKWKDNITFIHTQDTIELIKALNIMWKRNPFMEDVPTAVSVVLFNLLPESYVTLPVFESWSRVERNKSFYSAIDKLNERYGYASVYFGGSHAAKYSAPMRIAFTQIPNLEIESDEKKYVLKRKG